MRRLLVIFLIVALNVTSSFAENTVQGLDDNTAKSDLKSNDIYSNGKLLGCSIEYSMLFLNQKSGNPNGDANLITGNVSLMSSSNNIGFAFKNLAYQIEEDESIKNLNVTSAKLFNKKYDSENFKVKTIDCDVKEGLCQVYYDLNDLDKILNIITEGFTIRVSINKGIDHKFKLLLDSETRESLSSCIEKVTTSVINNLKN